MPTASDDYPADVEATVYFCTLEALQNVAKYAAADRTVIRLARSRTAASPSRSRTTAEASTRTQLASGSGLQGMADRLAAVGGSLEIRSAPGQRHHRGGSCAGRRRLISEGTADRWRCDTEAHDVSGAGMVAFRIVGWFLGVATIGFSLLSIVCDPRSSDDPSIGAIASTSSAASPAPG